MLKALLDANAVDDLADPPERYDAIRRAVTDGSLDLLWTHVTTDELAATPDLQRRRGLLARVQGWHGWCPPERLSSTTRVSTSPASRTTPKKPSKLSASRAAQSKKGQSRFASLTARSAAFMAYFCQSGQSSASSFVSR